MLIVFLFYAWNVFRFYMSYLIYYLQFILPFVIHDLIYHLSSKMFLISLFYARLFVYDSKKIFLSYCSIMLVKNIRYNECFKMLAKFMCITSTKESILVEVKEYKESLQADGRQIRKVSRANHRGWISDSTIKMTKSWKFLLLLLSLLPVAHSRDSFRIRRRPF